MRDESRHLMNILTYTLGVITDSPEADRQRIADAYAEAQALTASIEMDNGSARPRIVACFTRFNACKAAEDIAAAAWMLVAVQERIAEHDLAGWPALKIVADKAAGLLARRRESLH